MGVRRRASRSPEERPQPGTRGLLGADERAVVALVRKRLELGAVQYGALDVVGDRRDWVREALEEALDLSVYLAAALLRLGRGGGPPRTRTRLPEACRASSRRPASSSARERGRPKRREGR